MNNTPMKSVKQVESAFSGIPRRYIIQNAPKFFEEVSRAFLCVLDLVISYDNKYASTYISQAALADIAFGGSRGHGNRMIRDLHALGLVIKTNRGRNRTCLYRLSPYFRSPEIRNMLKKYLPSLAVVPLTLSLYMLYPVKNVTRYNRVNINNNYSYVEEGTNMDINALSSYKNMAKQKSVVDNKATTEKRTVDKSSTDQRTKEQLADRDLLVEKQFELVLHRHQRDLKTKNDADVKERNRASIPGISSFRDRFPPPAYTREEDKKLKGDV